jgi:hypothetical protein
MWVSVIGLSDKKWKGMDEMAAVEPDLVPSNL